MRYFDTHAHIGLITEDPIDQLIVVQEARQEGVQHLVTVSNNLIDFSQLYENLKTESHIYHSIGISPSSVEQPGEDWEAKIMDGTRLERVVAIGEIGLDYYRKFGDRDSQVELFIRQLELAEKLSLPVIIHASTFTCTAQRRASNNRNATQPRMVSSPAARVRLLRCGHCGAGMTQATGKSGRYRHDKCTIRLARTPMPVAHKTSRASTPTA